MVTTLYEQISRKWSLGTPEMIQAGIKSIERLTADG